VLKPEHTIPYLNKTLFWSYTSHSIYPLRSVYAKGDSHHLSNSTDSFHAIDCALILHTQLDTNTQFGLEMTKKLKSSNWDVKDLQVGDFNQLVDYKFDVWNLSEDNNGSVIDFKWLKRLTHLSDYLKCEKAKRGGYIKPCQSYWSNGALFFIEEKKNWNSEINKVSAITTSEHNNWILDTFKNY